MRNLKRISLITGIIILLLITYSCASTGKVTSSSVRVRETTSTNSKILTNLYRGDEVEVLEEISGWYKVKVNGKEGYIKSEYLSVTEDNTSESESENTNHTNTKVYVKSVPSFSANNIGTIDSGKTVTIKDQINNWYKISDGNVTGWVLNNKLGGEIAKTEEPETETTAEPEKIEQQTTETPKQEEKEESTTTTTETINKVGIVSVRTARVRKEPSKTGEIIDLLDYNNEVTVEEKQGTWYKINYNGKNGYMDTSLITLKDEQGVSSRSLSEERQVVLQVEEPVVEEQVTETEISTPVNSASGQSVVDFAMQYIGYSYVSGGKSPSTGFDCSGFTKYVFSNYGYELGATAASQVAVGREVSRGELIPGDLLLFYDDAKTKIGHTGIYIGNGDFVHAANPKRGVVTDNINTSTYYDERYITARRVVE